MPYVAWYGVLLPDTGCKGVAFPDTSGPWIDGEGIGEWALENWAGDGKGDRVPPRGVALPGE